MQFVGDKDDGVPVLDHLAQSGKELVDLLGRKHGGRLVEDQQRGPPVQRFDDLHSLSLAHSKLPDVRIRVDLEAIDLAQFPDPLRYLVQVGQGPPAGGQSQSHVFGHSERVDQHKVLVDHADAQVDGIGRRVDAYLLAVQPDVACVSFVHPVQDLHQRALACPILSQQGVYFTGVHVKVDVVAGQHTGKALDDPFHLQMVDSGTARRQHARWRLLLFCHHPLLEMHGACRVLRGSAGSCLQKIRSQRNTRHGFRRTILWGWLWSRQRSPGRPRLQRP